MSHIESDNLALCVEGTENKPLKLVCFLVCICVLFIFFIMSLQTLLSLFFTERKMHAAFSLSPGVGRTAAHGYGYAYAVGKDDNGKNNHDS